MKKRQGAPSCLVVTLCMCNICTETVPMYNTISTVAILNRSHDDRNYDVMQQWLLLQLEL